MLWAIVAHLVYYKDGAWTTDTPGDPWVQIDKRTVSNNDYVAPFTEYRKADGSETTLGTIPCLDLKKALFAIWLGEVPAQDSLKKALLGAP